MVNRSMKYFVVVLAIVGLGAQSTCNFLGDVTGNTNTNDNGNVNDNANTNTNDNVGDNTNTNANTNDNVNGNANANDNTNTNDNVGDNTNTNDNGNDNVDDSDFALFTDPEPGSTFSTTDVRDIDGETVKFRISNQAIVYQDGTEYDAGSWPVTGDFLGGVSFQVRFGTQDGMRQAYFTETGPATICDFVVNGTFQIFPTTQTVPQE